MSRRRYTPIGRLEQYMSNIRWPKGSGSRLVIPSYSVSPKYKIMLFPYRHGDALPETTWSVDHTRLTVNWADQADVYQFSQPAETERTTFTLTRAGRPVSDL